MSRQDPYGQPNAKPAEKDASPRIELRKRPCSGCGEKQWRPDGKPRCVGCELYAAGGRHA